MISADSNSNSSTQKAQKRIAIVTGANKGIGYEIAKQILQSNDPEIKVDTLVIGCRNYDLGSQAQKSLSEFGECDFIPLDISNQQSIDKFVTQFVEKHGDQLHILVNNAAFAFKGADPTPHHEQAEPTMKTNFFGTVNFTEKILSYLMNATHNNNSAKVVNVASMAGKLGQVPSSEKRNKLQSNDLYLEELQGLCSDFVWSTQNKRHERDGWGGSCYGMSKLGVIAATRV